MNQTLAFVFPGQGSQHLGMLAELAAQNPVVEQTFAEASEALGYDLWQLTQDGPEADLNSTDKTQPALLTAGVALWRVWQQSGGEQPAQLAGHSLGEYTALVCAGVMTLAQGVKLVEKRGQLMQAAVPAGEGAMAAVLGLENAAIEQACQDAAQGEVVSAVNYNSPGQVVIAGQASAVARAVEACKAAGAKRAVELPVSVPSHCALMKPAAEQLAVELDNIELQSPQIPVVQNVDARVAGSVEQIKQNLVAQLHSPVLWTDSVQAMAAEGAETLLECGPGKVLSGLNKRIQRSLSVAAINDPAGLEKALGA
ncbi:[acyl-carrier-protein] S-malonyltransferase [Motiliproteus coralliicola]|uniref:Malonyl CoA-acyl carrier protein transacylase n=1 Tax=Motiliproteus coralliicola TaxID=2283196 RepID=A0A369WRJ5_9GAMM|nr:ACP S-malonyltransferase [Motiliproteus coralliicola]RDE24720.1 [acyl-carrier-protein] S-malonyltransferase [Motiliproteus coralliicola]